jgi:endonuclease-3
MDAKLKLFLEMIEKIAKNLPKKTPVEILKNSYRRNPYTILMVTLLSLRSKDEETAKVAKKIFCEVQTPKELLKIPQSRLEDIIRPIGFQKKKAQTLIDVSKTIIQNYDSQVPNSKKELLKIKGVGEKTANVVLNNAFGIDTIAVDTHLHRLCNFWGVVDSKSEKETSKILNEIIPKDYKKSLNSQLVAFGQTVCKVNNPQCEICPVKSECQRLRGL